jgi:hypothetical protein
MVGIVTGPAACAHATGTMTNSEMVTISTFVVLGERNFPDVISKCALFYLQSIRKHVRFCKSILEEEVSEGIRNSNEPSVPPNRRSDQPGMEQISKVQLAVQHRRLDPLPFAYATRRELLYAEVYTLC